MCASGRRTEVPVIFEGDLFGELNCLIAQKSFALAKTVANDQLCDEE
jgi:hypothetical protein